jgi:hypothetical protein
MDGTRKEDRAERRLKRFDTRADRRLGKSHSARSRRKASFFQHREKGALIIPTDFSAHKFLMS